MVTLPDTQVAMNVTNDSQSSRWTFWAALAYTAFPIYGSLIPFRWAPQPFDEAVAHFAALLAGPVTVASRADFAANVLLALPLALLWLAAVVEGLRLRRGLAVALAGAVVWGACMLLALALEFSQIFFSGRQPAVSDCVAQGIGAAIGVGAWFLVPTSFWRRGAGAHAAWRRAFGVYMAGVVLYALLPLDLTVSRSEIASKWSAGLVHPVPFLSWRGQPLAGLTDFVLDMAIWALAAWLARRARGGVALGASGWALVVAAALLEVVQLLVMSRVVDATDVVAAAAGVGVGSFAAGVRAAPAAADGRAPSARVALPVTVALTLLVLHTWPFDFATDSQALRSRLATLSALPFASYATNTELYLVTNVLRRVAQFAAFALSCLWAFRPWRPSRATATVVVSAATVGLAASIEALQVFLPQRVVDTGDLLIAGVVGALLAWLWPDTDAVSATPARRDRSREPARAEAGSRRMALAAAAAVLGTAVALGYLPQVPYNVRELLAPGGLPWPSVVVSAAALALFGAPGWLAVMAVPRPAVPAAATAMGLAGVPVVLALLLYVGVPRESVHDIVGSPVFGAAAAGETVGRLAALLLGAVWSLAVGHALHGGTLPRGQRGAGVAHLLLHGCWVVPVWHLIVVRWAGTDNLTELMVGGGGIYATTCLLAYGVLVGVTGSALWRAVRRPGVRRTLGAMAVLLASTLAGWVLLAVGTESAIVKYGRVFSALQFLLSTDRSAYADGLALVSRFAVAHAVLAGLACAGLLFAGALPRSRHA